MDILNHPDLSLAGLLGRTGSRAGPYNHPYVSQGWPRTIVFSPSKLSLGLFSPFLTDEPLQFPLPIKSFYLLLQVIAFRCVVAMTAVEMTLLVSKPLARVSLPLARECQGSFVLNLR